MFNNRPRAFIDTVEVAGEALETETSEIEEFVTAGNSNDVNDSANAWKFQGQAAR